MTGAGQGPAGRFLRPDGTCPPANTFCQYDPPLTVCEDWRLHVLDEPGACPPCADAGTCGMGIEQVSHADEEDVVIYQRGVPDDRPRAPRHPPQPQPQCQCDSPREIAVCDSDSGTSPIVLILFTSFALMFIGIMVMLLILVASCARN